MSNLPSLLMLAYYFPPRGGSGVQRSLKFAKYLPDRGYNPVVITVTEDEITQTNDQSLLREIPDVPVYRAASGESTVKAVSRLRLGSLVSLALRPDAHILWRKGVMQQAEEAIKKHDVQAIYVSVQPWSAAVIGLELKRKYGLPLVVDFRDPWSFSTSLHWPSDRYHARDCKLEEDIFREADSIISVTPGIVERYQELYPFAADKIQLIYNGFDPADFPAGVSHNAEGSDQPKLKIGFAGRLYSIKRSGASQGLKGVLERMRYRNGEMDFSTHSLAYVVPALVQLFERSPYLRQYFEFHLAGNIPESNHALVQQAGLSDCIHFHGLLQHKEAVELIADSDIAFLPMMTEGDGQRSFNASGKIFEYLYNKTPILAAVPEGDAADIVRKSHAGWVVDPKNVDALAEMFKKLILLRKEGPFPCNQDKAYVSTFERSHQATQLAKVLSRVIDVTG